MRRLLLVVCLLDALPASWQEPAAGAVGPVVALKHGRVRGEFVHVRGTEKRVKQYLAIPFARPPVGPFAWLRAEPEPWEGEREGRRQPPMCIPDPDIIATVSRLMSLQVSPVEVSEDCLYLTVSVQAAASAGAKIKVMVWIHGGGLAMGAASQFDGAPLAAYQNIITVVIQYRLGILGFLSTGDEHARGNWGLLDQLAALRWVQDNIGAFGGDPQAVTVAGESAGAISASILTLSPKAEGLFQRAIFQSGVATIGSYTIRDPRPQAKIVANLTGCQQSSTEEMIRCVKGKKREDLIRVAKQMRIFLGAVVDGDFLTDTAEELLRRKEVLKVPVLMGITNHEFGWILPQSFAPPGWDKGMNRESTLAVVNMFNPSGTALANSLIIDQYLRDARTPEEIRDRFTHLVGDILMMLPVLSVAGYLSDAGVPVYLYEFAYRADVHGHSRPSFVMADHGDDVAFMFGSCFWDGHTKLVGNVTQQDEGVCRTMMSYWASFVRTGSPTGPSLPHWPQYDRERQEYLELGLTQTPRQKLKEDALHFLTAVLPQRLRERAAG
uniref:Carboxylic ester hydrolase n=1 Tax=Tetraodon nigroviridis TaxID=99883 RepID=H3CFZ4_TETNG